MKESALFRTPVPSYATQKARHCALEEKKKVEPRKKCIEKVKCKSPGVCGLASVGEGVRPIVPPEEESNQSSNAKEVIMKGRKKLAAQQPRRVYTTPRSHSQAQDLPEL